MKPADDSAQGRLLARLQFELERTPMKITAKRLAFEAINALLLAAERGQLQSPKARERVAQLQELAPDKSLVDEVLQLSR